MQIDSDVARIRISGGREMRGWLIGLITCTSTVSYGLDVREIELRRLFEPTPAELRGEATGNIYIYDPKRSSWTLP